MSDLITEARLDAKAFRENTVYDSEGDPIRLTANADRLDRYADRIAELEAENARLKADNGRLRESLGTIYDLCQSEINTRWMAGNSSMSETEAAKGSRLYPFLSLPRNLARAALKEIDNGSSD